MGSCRRRRCRTLIRFIDGNTVDPAVELEARVVVREMLIRLEEDRLRDVARVVAGS